MSDNDTTETIEHEDDAQDVVLLPETENSLTAINGKMIPLQMAEDFETARDNFRELIKHGQDGLRSMLELAKDTDHPRAYEVLTSMLGTVGNLNKQLMDLNLDVIKTAKDFADEDKLPTTEQGAPAVQNNTFLVAGTNDVQEMFRRMQNGEDIQDFPNGIKKE
jgi:hypothetical protein